MRVRDLFAVLDRRKWIVLAVTVVTIAAVGVLTRLMTPTYSASSLVRIARVIDPSGDFSSITYADRVMTTYVELLQGRSYMAQVVERLGLDASPDALSDVVQVESLPNTELLRISVEHPRPEVARDVANTLAVLLREEGDRIYSGAGQSAREILQEQLLALEGSMDANRTRLQVLIDSGQTAETSQEVQDLRARISAQEQLYAMLLDEYDAARVRERLLENSISIVEEAVTPTSPSKPRVRLNMILSVIVGLSAGTALAFLVDNLNRSIHTTENLEAAGIPVLGSVPAFMSPRETRGEVMLIEDDEPLVGGPALSPAGEAFRALRSILLSATAEAGLRPRSLLITSALPGEGKSTVVVNLGKVIAQTGRRVTIVDGDLRRPSMHRVFGLANDIGLSTLILGRTAAELTSCAAPRCPASACSPVALPRYPAELLSSSSMQALVHDLAEEADIVLFDSPPVLATPTPWASRRWWMASSWWWRGRRRPTNRCTRPCSSSSRWGRVSWAPC